MNSDIKERVVLHSLICLVSVLLILATRSELDVNLHTLISLPSIEAPEALHTSNRVSALSHLALYSFAEFAQPLRPDTEVINEVTPSLNFATTAGEALGTFVGFDDLPEALPSFTNRDILLFAEDDFLSLAIRFLGSFSVPLALLMLLAEWWRWSLVGLALLFAVLAMITFEQYRAARMKELNGALCESQKLTEQLTVQQIELGKAYRTLALDYAVIRALNESPTPEEAAQLILQTICVSTGWDIGAIWDVDSQCASPRCLGVWQKSLTDAGECQAHTRENIYATATGLLRRVLVSREPQWMVDCNNLKSLPRLAVQAETGVQSGFGLPILSGGEIIGVLEFYSSEVRQPEPELTQILATITSHIGQLIQRRRAEEALSKSRNDHLLELQRVRRRIANDLHDDVGSSLTKIALISETLRQKVVDAVPEAGEQLTALTTISNELVETMSDIVWAINPRNDRLSTLSQRMRRYASDIFSARQIRFRFQSPASDAVLGANLRREVFLIFKESVNNVVKHSECSEVVFGLAVNEEKLTFSISDNGSGIDPQIINADTGYLAARLRGGNGLSNMRRRAREMGGQFEVLSSKGQGTTISVKFPFVYGLSVGQ